MKFKRILSCVLMAMVLMGAFGASAYGETYPIYEVTTKPAFLCSKHVNAENERIDIIYTVPEGSLVLVADKIDEWYLVYTQDELIGYIRDSQINKTGDDYELDFKIRAEDIAKNDKSKLEFITIDPQAVLPDAAAAQKAYPATITRGEIAYDEQELLLKLLGEGYIKLERGEYPAADEYESAGSEKYAYIYDRDKAFWYRDPMVSGERGGEYEPPKLNMLPDESLLLLRFLLEGVANPDWVMYPSVDRRLSERFGIYDRWMTESDYARFMKDMKLHWFDFEHRTEDGLRIEGDEYFRAAVGVNGLDNLTVSWHNFTTETGEQITPMPIEQAIDMAETTRYGKAILLYAQLAYSNWLTQDDTFNLSWYLITNKGNYVVDCVLGKHMCDSYEH